MRWDSKQVKFKILEEAPLKRQHILWRILFIFLVLCGTGLAIHLFGRMEASLGPMELEMRLDWARRGSTRVILPPMGEVIAKTHHAPIALSVRLNRLEPELLQMDLSQLNEPVNYLQDLIPEFRHLLRLFILRLLAVGGIAGGTVGLIIGGYRDWRRYGLACLVGLAFTGIVLIGVSVEYDQKAFSTPRYEGMLEAAPWILDLLEKGISHVDDLGHRLETVAGNLNRVMGQVDQLESLARADGEIKVIHVSDIHNNPAAYEFLTRVVRGFGADLIIDTGDMTDFGTPLETQLAGRLAELKIPYYFISGNHETQEAIARLRQISGLKIIDGETVSFKGLTILGLGDPAGKNGKLSATPEELKESAATLHKLWSEASSSPDLVAVHNRKTADRLIGKAPVILHGHDHQAKIYEKGKSWMIDAGSSGAEGIRGLENKTKDGAPYSLALLRYDRAPEASGHQYELTVVDLIKVYSVNGRFILERKVLKGGDGDPALSSSLALPGAARQNSKPNPTAEAQ